MTTDDWFVGSASKRIGSRAWVHAIGFRSERALLALVACDIDDVATIDLTAITAHLSLHPIETVEVLLVASGIQDAIGYRSITPNAQHQVIHAMVDAIVDALTFGCPATIRVTPHALQWRKFDEHPIATLTLHPQPQQIDTTLHQQLTRDCGEPVLIMRTASLTNGWDTTAIAAQLTACSAIPVSTVTWRHQDNCWVLCFNQTPLAIIPGTLASTPDWPHHVVASRPHYALTANQSASTRRFLQEAHRDVNHD